MEVFYEKGKKYNCRVKGKPYFRTSITIDGKLRQIYGDGEKDANRKKEELKKLSASGINLDYQKANTGDVFKHWFYDIKRSDKDLKASTFTRYNSAIHSTNSGISINRISTTKFRRLCLEISSSQVMFSRISSRYSAIMTLPLTPPTSYNNHHVEAVGLVINAVERVDDRRFHLVALHDGREQGS